MWLQCTGAINNQEKFLCHLDQERIPEEVHQWLGRDGFVVVGTGIDGLAHGVMGREGIPAES